MWNISSLELIKMSSNSSCFNGLSGRLKCYFKNNLKFVLKTEDKIFIVTKNDIFHEINIYDVNIQLINSSDEISVIEKTRVEELCFKKIIDVNYGKRNYIARTEDGRVYCWGNNYYGQMGNGKHDEDFIHYNKPELNELLSDLYINFINCE